MTDTSFQPANEKDKAEQYLTALKAELESLVVRIVKLVDAAAARAESRIAAIKAEIALVETFLGIKPVTKATKTSKVAAANGSEA